MIHPAPLALTRQLDHQPRGGHHLPGRDVWAVPNTQMILMQMYRLLGEGNITLPEVPFNLQSTFGLTAEVPIMHRCVHGFQDSECIIWSAAV